VEVLSELDEDDVLPEEYLPELEDDVVPELSLDPLDDDDVLPLEYIRPVLAS